MTLERANGGWHHVNETALQRAMKKAVQEAYGKQHAFFNDTHPDIYNAEAARDAWEKTLAFFNANLR